jgi:acyl-CoA dehydrogenase
MVLSNHDLRLFFEPHHHALADELASVDEALERYRELDASALARDLGARLGLYRWLVPDGDRLDVRALCLIRETLGYASPPADAIFAVQGLASFPLRIAPTPERRALLARVKSGDAIGAFALTEPNAGSDVAALAATARRDGDGFVLDGEKTFISNAPIASHFIVFANADPSAGRKGISAFLVEHGAPGLFAKEPIPMLGGHPIGRVRLAGCRVGGDALLGAVGEGFAIAMRTLDTFRVTVGAAAVGMARRALDETLARVKSRVQFGKPLAEQQLVQAAVAEMAMELDAARLLVLRAAHLKDGGRERAPAESAMAKLYATEAAQRIIDRAVQLHGALGVTAGSVVERLYREIRPLRIYEGTSEIQKLIIAKQLLTDRE